VKRIAIEAVARSGRQLSVWLSADRLRFATSFWWQDVDLDQLASRHGDEAIDRILFHVAACELLKLVSLRPEVVDLGPCARFHTRAFVALWRALVRGVWGQWRWEHDLPDYAGPAFAHVPVDGGRPVAVPPGPVELLLFSGGGKDSLVAMKLLERAGAPYATLAYAHSVYGSAAPQHALIDRLLDHGAPTARHRQWVYEDFLDAPLLALGEAPGIERLLAAETPSSIFAALPLALAGGYRQLVLAHERSANDPNLIWERTGEGINHQWGKSLEAERLLDGYIRAELADMGYFSLLQPIHDPVIFALAARDPDAVAVTHSCNVRKPWCGRCAKCAYVFLCYRAWLPAGLAERAVGRDLFVEPDNARWFRELLGLAAHSPFECVGQPGEAQLALARVRRADPTALAQLAAELPPVDEAALLERYGAVSGEHRIPPALAERVLPQMVEAAQRLRT
jgi:hypothetical protein